MRRLLLAALPLALTVLPALAATTQVAIRGSAYEPPAPTIAPGDTVTWTNRDPIDHTVTADNAAFDSKEMSTGDTFSYTFRTAGTFAYHCTIHPDMRGTVTVRAAAGSSSTTTLATTTTTSSTTTTTTRPTTTTTTRPTTTTTTSTTVAEETTTTTAADTTTSTTAADEVAVAVPAPSGDDAEPSYAGPTAFAALLLAAVSGGAALAVKRGL